MFCDEVQAWPDTLRVIPARWCEALLDGKVVPQVVLARHLVLNLEDWPVHVLRLLLRHSALSHVSEVTLRHLQHRASDWVAALLPLAPRLRALTLEDFPLRHLDLRRLFGGRAAWPSLERLVMTASALDVACVEALVSCDLPQALQVLGLSRTKMGGAALHALLEVPWPVLRSLDLSGNPLGDDAVPILASASLGALRELFLVQSGLTEQGWRHLQSAPWRPLLGLLDGEPSMVSLETLSSGLPALRGALYHGASAETWAEICEVVEQWPAEQDWAVGCAYAQDLLSSWPDTLRTVPVRWQRRAAQEQVLPRGWALARTLEVQAWAGSSEALTQLFTPEGVGGLRRFSLDRVVVDEAMLTALSNTTSLDTLHHFGLSGCEVSKDSNKGSLGARLHEASWWSGLRSLTLSGLPTLHAPQDEDWCLPRDLRVLALSDLSGSYFRFDQFFKKALPKGLQTLLLTKLVLDVRSALALMQTPELHALRTLDVSHTKFTGAVWGELMKSPLWCTLEALVLTHSSLSQTIEKLRARRVRVPVSSIQTLNLSHNRLGDRGLGTLASLDCFPHLTHLNLESSGFGPRAGKILSYGPWSSSLQRLDLSYNLLGAQGVGDMTQASWPALAHLNLSGNSLGQAGLAQLTLAPWWRRLSSLRLDGNGLTGSCVALLTSLRESEHLKVLSLGGNFLNSQEIRDLKVALPHVHIRA